jgi:hypothetical protein
VRDPWSELDRLRLEALSQGLLRAARESIERDQNEPSMRLSRQLPQPVEQIHRLLLLRELIPGSQHRGDILVASRVLDLAEFVSRRILIGVFAEPLTSFLSAKREARYPDLSAPSIPVLPTPLW